MRSVTRRTEARVPHAYSKHAHRVSSSSLCCTVPRIWVVSVVLMIFRNIFPNYSHFRGLVFLFVFLVWRPHLRSQSRSMASPSSGVCLCVEFVRVQTNFDHSTALLGWVGDRPDAWLANNARVGRLGGRRGRLSVVGCQMRLGFGEAGRGGQRRAYAGRVWHTTPDLIVRLADPRSRCCAPCLPGLPEVTTCEQKYVRSGGW